MTTDFSALKKASSTKQNFDRLVSELNKVKAPFENSADDRYWYPEVDKAGNGYAVIRFLAAPPGEQVPFVKIWTHGFKGPSGQWYIENSLTTFSEADPVSELNNKLWNSGIESDKKIAREQKRQTTYTSNILVIKDPAHPENEGKTFLYKYGPKIFDKINDAANPQFPDDPKVDVFDFWEGADFKLKIRNVEGYRNYDKSEFDSSSALFGGDDEKIEALWRKLYSLQELLDRKHFKSYNDLKARLLKVLGESENGREESYKTQEAKPAKTSEARPAPARTADETPEDDNDETMSFFAKLAKEE